MGSLRTRISAANAAANATANNPNSLEQRVYDWSVLSKDEKEGMAIPLRLLRNYACYLGLRDVQRFTKTNKMELVKMVLEAEPVKILPKTIRSVSFANRASVSSTILGYESCTTSESSKSTQSTQSTQSRHRRDREDREAREDRERRRRRRSNKAIEVDEPNKPESDKFLFCVGAFLTAIVPIIFIAFRKK